MLQTAQVWSQAAVLAMEQTPELLAAHRRAQALLGLAADSKAWSPPLHVPQTRLPEQKGADEVLHRPEEKGADVVYVELVNVLR